MLTIFLNALGILFILSLAFFLKKVGFLQQKDGTLISKIVIYVTLPVAIIVGVNGTKISEMFFVLMFLGIISNLIMITLGSFFGRKENSEIRALYMFKLSGYNIGNFSIPFVSGIFPAAIPFLAMFDMGNSLMIGGTTEAIVETTVKRSKNGFILRDIALILLKAPPFVAYILMFLMALFGLAFPETWLIPLRPIGSANTFLSIFTIGLFMEFRLPKGKMNLVMKILVQRYLMAIIFGAIVYFALPFPDLVKKVLLLLVFCPMSFYHMIKATEFGNDKAITGLIVSLSMLISLILMSIIVIIL